MRVVVVEPERMAGKVLEFVLADAGHEVVVVASAEAAIGAIVGRETDAVLTATDLPRPGPDGFALCKELRGRRYTGPLLFVSPHSAVEDKVRAFAVGADDYLVAPCDPRELLARVEAMARRFRAADRQGLGTILRAGDAELSLGELTFRRDGCAPALLTPVEMRLLECLMRNQGITIGRETLIERVWGFDFLGDSNRVDVYIRRVRKKVEVDAERPAYIHTMRGLGYVFRPPAPDNLVALHPATEGWADRQVGD
jgi:DNA-binding response OmpR family regulator